MASFTNKIKINSVQLKSNEPMYSNRSWTGQRIIRSTGIQYYTIQFQLTFNTVDRAEVMNFLALYSQGEPFTLNLGHFAKYNGNQTGALTATSQAAKGSMVVSTINSLAVGELIQFTNHKKIYRVIDRTNTNITIFPSLQNVVQANETITYNNLVIEAVLDPDNDYSMDISTVTSITLKASENII
ncbi:hypothetical protein [Kosakonia radicincitans]|uniref:hypothetical protein n=1 Tax=Kosakonia radicincitans TaxID=283686 RepID=UPI00236779A3|nr:hypothetical protein [Kosakonia radicincitans]MDD7993763.1 hypothetical protein [Kosakonia radicincitans]